MITFILIFFVAVITVGLLSVIGFTFYLKRRNKSLAALNNQRQFEDAPPYRSLFAPDEAEIRAHEREAQMKAESERKEAEQKTLAEKAKGVRDFERIWRESPTRQNTVELFRLAAMSESADIFSQTAENVIQVSLHDEQPGGLSKADLADLLDSHLRILPQQERLSGALFWVKREIERLRGKAE